jgi:tRNA (guanine37-N1)-methyltransferase
MLRKIWILTLFPEYFKPLLECGISGSAFRGERSEQIKFEVILINIRDYSPKKYKSVDDTPYGGGPGMIMRADILRDALMMGVVEKGGYSSLEDLHVIYTSPRGKVWNNRVAREFGTHILAHPTRDLVFICGRYEGVDERFLEKYVNDYYSIGDFVLTGGELAVMTMLDSSVRFVPGILGNKLSSEHDSFEDGLIEYPQYTRPIDFEGILVPETPMSGNHKKIEEWQLMKKKEMTTKWRPDLLTKK